MDLRIKRLYSIHKIYIFPDTNSVKLLVKLYNILSDPTRFTFQGKNFIQKLNTKCGLNIFNVHDY